MTEHEEAGWLASPAEPTSPDWDRSGPDPTHHQTLARSVGRRRRRRLALLLPTAQPLRRRLPPPTRPRLGSRSSAGASLQELRYPPRPRLCPVLLLRTRDLLGSSVPMAFDYLEAPGSWVLRTAGSE
jgi:hypothetical protein